MKQCLSETSSGNPTCSHVWGNVESILTRFGSGYFHFMRKTKHWEVIQCAPALHWTEKNNKKTLTTLYPHLHIITAAAVQFMRLAARSQSFFIFLFAEDVKAAGCSARRCHRQHIPRRRQDGRRTVSCFIKDHSTSNYTVTTVWLRGPRAPQGEKKRHKRMKGSKSGFRKGAVKKTQRLNGRNAKWKKQRSREDGVGKHDIKENVLIYSIVKTFKDDIKCVIEGSLLPRGFRNYTHSQTHHVLVVLGVIIVGQLAMTLAMNPKGRVSEGRLTGLKFSSEFCAK